MTTGVLPSAVIGLLWSSGASPPVPADPWPLREALEELDNQLREPSELVSALRRWPQPGSPMSGRFGATRVLLRQLAASGHVQIIGRGRTAGWIPAPAFIEASRAALDLLGEADRQALALAAQCLVASANRWANRARTSGPSGSEVVTSGINR
jgi:hypothetical protein